MKIGERELLVGILILGVVLIYLFYPRPHHKEPFVIEGSVDNLIPILEANTVIVRTVYPFTDAQGAVAATTYLSTVLSAKGKKVILQSIRGNVCYTNEGNVENVVEKNLEECELNLPTIVVREGTGRIVIKPYLVEIYGPPPYLMPAASFLLKKIYPDADQIYYSAMERISAKRRGG